MEDLVFMLVETFAGLFTKVQIENLLDRKNLKFAYSRPLVGRLNVSEYSAWCQILNEEIHSQNRKAQEGRDRCLNGGYHAAFKRVLKGKRKAKNRKVKLELSIYQRVA